MADISVIYLEDASALPRYFDQLYDNGYIPSMVKSVSDKGVIEHKVRHYHFHGQNIATCIDRTTLIDAAKANPGRGVGVHMPHTLIPGLLLNCFDVDFNFDLLDPTYSFAHCLASVVHDPAPTRLGGKGLGMFYTTPEDFDIEALIRYKKLKGVNHRKQLGPEGFMVEAHGFTTGYHMVLPPSAYPTGDGSDAPGGKQYTWIEFPSIDPAKRLFLDMMNPDGSSAVENLPCLDHWRLMEVVLHATRMLHKSLQTSHIKFWERDHPGEFPPLGDNAIRDFIMSDPWTPGAGYRSRMMGAVHSYIGEGFPPEYTRTRMLEILKDHHGFDRDPAWGHDDTEYEHELDELIRGSVSKIEEKGGPKPSKRRAEVKIPDERVIAAWMEAKYPRDKTRLFEGEAYHWTGDQWHPVRIHDPEIYQEAAEQHEAASYASIDHGLKGWYSSVREAPMELSATTVVFQNGTYDFGTREFRPALMEDYNPHTMRVPYDPDAKCPLWEKHMSRFLTPPDEVVEELSPEQIAQEKAKAVDTFEEFMGYSMTRNMDHQHVLFVIGATATGKSTIWKMVDTLFPKDSVGGVAYEDLGNATSRDGLMGKMINIGHEVGRRAHASDQALLAITSGDRVEVHRMHTYRTQVRIGVHLIFDGNHLPSSSDMAGAFQRRAIIILTTDKPIPEEERDTNFDAKLTEELPGIVARWTRAYERLCERERFDIPQYSRNAGEQIRREATSCALFISETIEKGDIAYTVSYLYGHYRDWCELNGHKAINSHIFGQDLTKAGYPSTLQWNPVLKKPFRVRNCTFNDPTHPSLRLIKDQY